MKRQDLAHLQATVEIALLRNHRDALLDLDRVARHVDPHDPTDPLVGSTLVLSTPMVVVLPAPFGLSNPRISPRRTSDDTPRALSLLKLHIVEIVEGAYSAKLVRSKRCSANTSTFHPN
jgi:hypothetical protein